MVSRPLWHVLHEIGVPAAFRATCAACAPAMFGYAAPTPPLGGLAWQEAQPVRVRGDPAAWQTVHSGAEETGEAPVTAWQFEQLFVKAVCVAWKWVLSKKGTAWLGAPGPPEWQKAATPSALVNDAEKQLGAPAMGPAPGPVTLWQIAQATPRFPESRWEAT